MKVTCHDCGKEIVRDINSCTTGYGIIDDNKVCYACCGKRDQQRMKNGEKIGLYLVKEKDGYFVSNWPGTLKMPVKRIETRILTRRSIDGCQMKNTHFLFVAFGKLWKGLCRNSEWNQYSACHVV